jgi:DNA polymerase-3 subunit beta
VLSTLTSERVKITLSDPNSSALLEAEEGSEALYVVMPMRL